MAKEKEEKTEVQDAENQAPVNKKDAFRQRIAGMYPDEDLSGDDAYYGKMGGIMDNYDKGEKERKHISDAFAKNPTNAAMFQAVMNGESLLSSWVRHYGIDGLMAKLQDPNSAAEFQKDQEQYLKSTADAEKKKKDWDSNMEKTLKGLEGLVSGGKYTDEDIDDGIKQIEEIVNDYFNGVIKPETFDALAKVKNYDSAVADAANQATIKAKNDKIDRVKLQQPNVPTLNSNSGVRTENQRSVPPQRNIYKDMKRSNL